MHVLCIHLCPILPNRIHIRDVNVQVPPIAIREEKSPENEDETSDKSKNKKKKKQDKIKLFLSTGERKIKYVLMDMDISFDDFKANVRSRTKILDDNFSIQIAGGDNKDKYIGCNADIKLLQHPEVLKDPKDIFCLEIFTQRCEPFALQNNSKFFIKGLHFDFITNFDRLMNKQKNLIIFYSDFI
ncbi:hypothetical protein RFI_09450 [Reticulomyxa filosa]|uniref:Uncharacterized protein n=1 Tax=Reticulomyxa filosa TaxID=46433 RepID=X6NQN9_RETFI|nr:hypothetical protein RFI_09450 [Reticulomyxa filosa]|eukprot:ETO27677.1 hypothetical protein RFI_09450 [Reticulomyxa filosa]